MISFSFSVPDYEIVHIHHQPKRREIPSRPSPESDNLIDVDDSKFEEPKTELKLKVFGKDLNLTLVPNRDLFKKNKLKIWTVEPNATAQHGVEYVELPQVGDIPRKSQ